jgi:hypothetical protein
MNQFKKLGTDSKHPSMPLPGLNLFKNLPPLVGQKRPKKIEPLNLLGHLKKKEDAAASSNCSIKSEKAKEDSKNDE